MKNKLAISILATALMGCQTTAPIYSGNNGPFPFSEAVQVGNILYMSGQIGVDSKTMKLAEGGIKGQTKQTMENIGATLKKNGLNYSDIFKCTVMLSNMADWADFNSVYVTYFSPGKFPARSAFGSSGLAFNGALELECWAYVK